MTEPHALMAGIEDLDLDMIKLKMTDPEEGEGWPREYADRVCAEYRKFLALTRAYPELAIVPSAPIDKFWHNHILDTQKYGPDCDEVFGFFLHHFPYFGMRGDADLANLNASWENTVAAYRRHFGEPPPGLWESGMRCPKCGRQAPFALPRDAAIFAS